MADKLDRATDVMSPQRAVRHPDRVIELEPGLVLGKYRIERKLGAGGMGAVWEARDTQLDRHVALKLLFAGNDRARLVRESRAMARLRHPNVLTVFDAETLGGHDVIAMELIDGEPLASWLTRRHSHDDIVAVLLDAGRGLAAAHAAGIIHRDFKPHNVLVERSGRVVVTDFGLARAVGESLGDAPEPAPAEPAAVDQTIPARPSAPRMETRDSSRTLGALDSPLTATGTVLGTPAYMAPEQVRGSVANERADQFSFCVTAWEALAGQRPFPGDTLPEIAAALADGVPRSADRVPRRIRGVLARGLENDPARRWPSIDALLAAIDRAWRRPRRIATGAAIAAGLALVVLTATAHKIGEWTPEVIDLPAFEENSDGAAYSPDGTKIAYASDRDRQNWYRIYVSTADGADETVLTPLGDGYQSPRWTRDGKALLLVAWDKPSARYRIVRWPIDGGPTQDLGEGVGADDCGDAVAIANFDDRSSSLSLVYRDGRRETLGTWPYLFAQKPRCDRSGQHVVYIRGELAAINQAGNDLYVIDREHHEVALTSDHRASSGVFAPDGRSVVYSVITASKIQMYEIAATGGTPRQLTTDNGPNLEPDISPDGKKLIFDHDETAEVVVAGGEATLRKLTARREMLSSILLAPDGASLIAERMEESRTQIVLISTADGTTRKLADGGQPFMSADGKRVLFAHSNMLMEVPLAGGTPRKVCDLPATMAVGTAGPSGVHFEIQRGTTSEWWHLDHAGKLEREDTGGLVFESPSGARLVRSNDHGYHLKFGDHDLVSESHLVTWLDDHRFSYAARGAFHIVDITTGNEVGTVPGPDWGGMAMLARDGAHWFDLEEVGHVTRHVITNVDDRPPLQ